MEARLQELLDEREVRRVMMRYCRGVDRRDRELIEATFHPDAICNDVDRGGEPMGKVRADTLLDPGQPMYSHLIGNELIEVNGDTAKCEFYFVSTAELTREGKPYIRMRGGRYIGLLERRDGTWRFKHRVSTDDWSMITPVERFRSHPPRGLPSRDDPVYEFWG